METEGMETVPFNESDNSVGDVPLNLCTTVYNSIIFKTRVKHATWDRAYYTPTSRQ
jgi:hypothetical protein